MEQQNCNNEKSAIEEEEEVNKNKIKNNNKKLKHDSTRDVEESVTQVLEKFENGCECQDDKCFKGLNPETIYRHRLNIAELTKAEHDMYLMGVTMACLTDPNNTAKNTERRRLRAQYVYQGRRVCLDAFLYLENCTHYQIKIIRKHIITHGVTPRVHGNHGKIPHNTFSLDIYQIATEFLKKFIQKHNNNNSNNNNSPIYLSPNITRKKIHNLYKDAISKNVSSTIKVLGYSTFRRFMKVQFPHVKFSKTEFIVKTSTTTTTTNERQNNNSNKSTSSSSSSSKLQHNNLITVENNKSDDGLYCQ